MDRKSITFYKLVSPYSEDVTKNCGLVGQEMDANFMNLKQMEIIDAYRDGKSVVLERVDGQKANVDLSPILSGMTTNFSVCYDSGEGQILINFNGKQAVIDGLVTVDNMDSIAMTKVISDSSLFGDGTSKSPLKISPVRETGTYAPADSLIDLINGGTMPSANCIIKGKRYVTREMVDDFGKLYNYNGVKRMGSDLALEGNGWRIPTKEDWDGMLNAVEPCDENRNHDTINGNVQCGKLAGKLLKSNRYWKMYSGTTSTCSAYVIDNSLYAGSACTGITSGSTPTQVPITPMGVDSYGFAVMPAGYGDGYQLNGYFRERAMFWTSTVSHVSDVYIKRFDYDKATVVQEIVSPNTIASIRLVKDYDGSNHYDTECILGQDYHTVLMPSTTAKTGYQVWTDVNISSTNCKYCPVEPNGGLGLPIEATYPTYYVTEWTGLKWLKHEMQEGESIVLLNGLNGEKRIEYRLVDGELQDVNTMVYNLVIERYDHQIQDLQSQIDDTKANISANADKIAAVEATVSVLADGLNAEVADRLKADTELSGAIQIYYNELTSADTRISAVLSDEAGERAKQDQLLWNRIQGETNERINADDAIKQSIADLSGMASTNLTDLINRLNNEVTQRQAEDANLNQKIDNEVNRATAADNNLGTRIDTLTNNVQTMVNQINENVAQSIDAINKNMADGFNTINGGIATEIEERKAADQALNERVDNLNKKVDELTSGITSDLGSQITELGNRIQEEVERAQEAEKMLTQNLNAEIQQRQKADSEITSAYTKADAAIQKALDEEVARATAKDEELNGRLVSQSGSTYSCADGVLTLNTENPDNAIRIQFESNYGTF